MIEEIDAVTGGSSRLRITSLLILGGTIFVLVMFAFFGTGQGAFNYTGSVTGTAITPETSLENQDVIQEPTISTLSEEGKFKLILNILKLKYLDQRVTKLQFAEKVSNIANYVDALNNNNVNEVWISMHSCLEIGCNDGYYDLLETVLDNAFVVSKNKGFIESIFYKEDPYAFMPELLGNVVKLQQAVQQDDIVEKSKVMIAVNSLISKVDSTETNDIWNELVNCDLKCPLYDDLIVKLTEFKINSLNAN